MGSLPQVPAGSLPALTWLFSASLVLGSSLCEEEGKMAAHGPELARIPTLGATPFASFLLLLVQLASSASPPSSICLQSLVSVLSTPLCSHLHFTSLCHHETSQKFCPSVWWLLSHPLLSPSSLKVWLPLFLCTQRIWSLFVRRSTFF